MSHTIAHEPVVFFRVETRSARLARRVRLAALIVGSHASALGIGSWIIAR